MEGRHRPEFQYCGSERRQGLSECGEGGGGRGWGSDGNDEVGRTQTPPSLGQAPIISIEDAQPVSLQALFLSGHLRIRTWISASHTTYSFWAT